MSVVKMEDMPQMPETQGFLEIFQEMLGLDLISQEWGIGMSQWIIVLIVIICLMIVGAIADAAWDNWTYEGEGILRRITAWFLELFQRIQDYFHHEDTIGERMKKALSFKHD